MKIRRVKWNNHPILGNLALDFINANNGKPYDTIILVGENGSGKTSVLRTLYEFLHVGPITPFEYIEYEADGTVYRVQPQSDHRIETFFDRVKLTDGELVHINVDRNNQFSNLKDDRADPRHYGSVFSQAQAIFEMEKIHTATSSSLDGDVHQEEFKFRPATLKQLLVDLHNRDNSEYANKGKHNESAPNPWHEYEHESSIHRFSSAINGFFNGALTYHGMKSDADGYDILFTKNGKDVSIDNLSTGESQIVFRGVYLLKNMKKLYGGTVFIDEPEMSMHPSWQERILSYYQHLFIDGEGQKVQMFVATHSEGVLSEALSPTQNNIGIIILKTEGDHIVQGSMSVPAALSFRCASEWCYQAFGTASTDYHNALYGFIQAEGWMDEYDSGKDTFPYHKSDSHGHVLIQKLTRTKMIRHQIHHPENTRNDMYTQEQLCKSIEEMREFILRKSIPTS